MTLADGQVQLRDLVFGAGAEIRFVGKNHFNPFSRAVRADQGGPRAWNHGNWSGAEFTEQVIIPMRLVIIGDESGVTGWLARMRGLLAAFAPSHEDLELRFALDGAEYVMFGRPRLVDPEARMMDGTNYVQAAFVALDPVMYSGAEHVESVMLPIVTGGLEFPIQFPIQFTATTVAGRVNLTNAGTATVGLRLRIDGPVVEPRVTLLVDGVASTLRFNLTLTAGQWLDVDTAARTVYMNGTASRRGNAAGVWPLLPSGTHELAFDAAAYDAAAELTVTWRDGWH